MRLVECLLAPELQKDFKEQNCQLTHLVFDAKYAHSPNYDDQSLWKKAVNLYNSQIQFKSCLFIEDYGSPFNKQKALPAVLSDFTMELESFWQKANALHGSVAKVDAKIKSCGQGVGSLQGNTIKQFCQDSGGGDSHAFTYLAFKFEGELHDFTTTLIFL